MTKFNVKAQFAGSVITTPGDVTDTITGEGAPAYLRDPKGELFILAVSNFVSEDTFYESGKDRDQRYEKLIHEVTKTDPQWVVDMLTWLRSKGNMRSASLVGAAEFVRARLGGNHKRNDDETGMDRLVVGNVLQRADEPGEILAYWSNRYGKKFPLALKKGVADAARKLYNQYSLQKYDTGKAGWRFGDVIEVTHAKPGPEAHQETLYRYAIERRHNRVEDSADALPMIRRSQALRVSANAISLTDPQVLREAGWTWEDALSVAGQLGIDKKVMWEAIIPSMGYMALLRNLRNFDEVGISEKSVRYVISVLGDRDQVARSRQFPYRFLSAYESLSNDRYKPVLNAALGYSLGNLPVLEGRTLVLIDTSASMTTMGYSARSKMTPAKAAAVLGVSLAMANGADLYGFADGVFQHQVAKGASPLVEMNRFTARTGEVGHGTNVAYAIQRTYAGHDRVFIVSDMQTMDGIGDVTMGYGRQGMKLDPKTYVYAANLGGYMALPMNLSRPRRYELSALTDATFKQVPLIEAGEAQKWPWQ